MDVVENGSGNSVAGPVDEFHVLNMKNVPQVELDRVYFLWAPQWGIKLKLSDFKKLIDSIDELTKRVEDLERLLNEKD